MKLKLFLFILFAISIRSSYAQQGESSVVGFGIGYIQNGIGLSLNYDYYLDKKQYLQGNILLGFSNEEVSPLKIKVNYEKILLNAGYFRELYYTSRGWLSVNVGAGISLGYHIINNGNKELSSGALITSDSKFVYGFNIGLENKIYLSDKFRLGIFYKQFYIPNSDLGEFSPFIGCSINYTLF